MGQNSLIWIGSIVGCLLGILGGGIGTWMSIKNTNGPREKAFMVRTAVVMWVCISLFLLLLYFLSEPWNRLIWIPYGIGLIAAIHYCNRRQLAISAEESPVQHPHRNE
ncbi:hypothetical protein [Gimesia chilikensis]|uniref:Uncharacterized protein n=1 Tax=Gimesia chilikensis TaxID=2605989 RepID=A0A517PM80_9PLAN|nr:hypothetical protein [Gimesia chilikensis]QDT20476.1 hypothetical protein HG66A1_22620 [Gimesia chilikensis]